MKIIHTFTDKGLFVASWAGPHFHYPIHLAAVNVPYGGKLLVSIKFGESVIRMYWRILNLAIASASV